MSILKEARALISNPEKWTQDTLAQKNNGLNCEIEEGDKFCAIGSLCKVSPGSDAYERLKAIKHLKRACERIRGYTSIPFMNDRSDHKTVLEVFDLAICMEECENERTKEG